MRVHIFKGAGSNLYGFTIESNGKNLPVNEGHPWTEFNSIEIFDEHPVPRIGVNEADILEGIRELGFYVTNKWVGE
jgi:hypothetical protein